MAKPVKYALVRDAGYPFHPQALSIRTADKAKWPPCLKKLFPIVQRAQIDFLQHPEQTNRLIVDLVRQYNTGVAVLVGAGRLRAGEDAPGVRGHGPDQTLGNFDMNRIRQMGIVTPIFTAQRQQPKAGLKAEDIATNQFIDTSIGVR